METLSRETNKKQGILYKKKTDFVRYSQDSLNMMVIMAGHWAAEVSYITLGDDGQVSMSKKPLILFMFQIM